MKYWDHVVKLVFYTCSVVAILGFVGEPRSCFIQLFVFTLFFIYVLIFDTGSGSDARCDAYSTYFT